MDIAGLSPQQAAERVTHSLEIASHLDKNE